MIAKLLSDFRGITRVCGVGTALRWMGCVAATLPQNLKAHNLLAADERMGPGPFTVHHKIGTAKLTGKQVFSGIREIWVRDVYARGDFVQIPDNGLVVDLGANMGNFSTMALTANRTARVLAVEPSRELVEKFRATMRVNGYEDRATLCQAFIGDFTPKQDADFANNPYYTGIRTISEADFIAQNKIERISFLKCDIEGSEFFMIEPGSRLLDLADRIAIEIHGFGGNTQAFLDNLEDRGFAIHSVDWYGADCIAMAARH